MVRSEAEGQRLKRVVGIVRHTTPVEAVVPDVLPRAAGEFQMIANREEVRHGGIDPIELLRHRSVREKGAQRLEHFPPRIIVGVVCQVLVERQSRRQPMTARSSPASRVAKSAIQLTCPTYHWSPHSAHWPWFSTLFVLPDKIRRLLGLTKSNRLNGSLSRPSRNHTSPTGGCKNNAAAVDRKLR